MHDDRSFDPDQPSATKAAEPSGSASEGNPGRALLAVGVSVALIVLLWTLRGTGPIALILLPPLALYVANVYLGGGLNESPIGGIERIRRWRSGR